MILRNYQEDIINKTRLSFASGHKRPLVVLPCGAGKTICFGYMATRHVEKGGYVWFLVHRQELIDQTLQVINSDNVLVGMVQTIANHIEDYKRPTLIIFDEAHHATANTWQKIINYFPEVSIIGLTATPCRLDGEPLGNIFDDLIMGVTSEWLINNKYLAPYDYYAPNINAMLPRVKGKDFDNANMGYESKIYGDIEKYISDRKTIIYCPNVAFSKQLANEIGGVHFDGDTPKNERKQIIEDFRNGKIKILCNVDLIGEGFDVPDCECVMLLRPTMSSALYIQQSMRCLRYKEGKRAIIYDFVGNVYRHGMPTELRGWSLDKKLKVRNPSGEKEILCRTCAKCYRVYRGINPICPYCQFDNHKTQKQIEQDKKQELEKIEALEKKKARMEVGRARDLESLIAIGKSRGYKNPRYWAMQVLNGRYNKI